jgi:hypothetical protein
MKSIQESGHGKMIKILSFAAAGIGILLGLSPLINSEKTPVEATNATPYNLTFTSASTTSHNDGTYLLTNLGNKVYFNLDDMSTFGQLSKGKSIANTTSISGLSSVSVALTSGSLRVFYGYSYAWGVNFYDTGVNLTSSLTAIDLSSYNCGFLRFVAEADSTFSSIVFNYRCGNIVTDSHSETANVSSNWENLPLDQGMGSGIQRFCFDTANVADSASSRSLKVTFVPQSGESWPHFVINLESLSSPALTKGILHAKIKLGASMQSWASAKLQGATFVSGSTPTWVSASAEKGCDMSDADGDGWWDFKLDLSSFAYTYRVVRLILNFHNQSADSSEQSVWVDRLGIDQGLETVLPLDGGYCAPSSLSSAASLSSEYTHGDDSSLALKLTLPAMSTAEWPIYGFNIASEDFQDGGTYALDVYFPSSYVAGTGSSAYDVQTWMSFQSVHSDWSYSTLVGCDMTSLGGGWYHASGKLLASAGVTCTKDYRLRLGFHSKASTSLPLFIDNLTFTPAPKEKVTLFQASNTENLLQGVDYSTSANGSKTSRGYALSFHAMKGESESVQLMMAASEAVSAYNFSAGALSDGAGHTIEASAFSVYAEKYLTIDSTNSNETAYASGAYPDALVPLANLVAKSENTIAAGKNQGLWISLAVGNSAVAGTYSGTGNLTVDGVIYSVPLSLTLEDVTMSKTSHARSSFQLWYEQIAYGESVSLTTELSLSYYNFLVAHRVMPNELYNPVRGDDSTFPGIYDSRIASNDAIDSYMIRLTYNADGSIDQTQLTTLLGNFITYALNQQSASRDYNPFTKMYFYSDDEPSYYAKTADGNSYKYTDYLKVKNHNETLRSVKTSLASRLDSYPALKASFLAIPNIVTVGYPGDTSTANEDIKRRVDLGVSTATRNDGIFSTSYSNETALYNDGMDTWCPTFDRFDSAAKRTLYSTRQTQGEKVWWYGCINQTGSNGYPSYHTNAPLISSRIIPWMQMDYGIGGNLFWCVNFFQYNSGASGAASTSRNLWSDGKSWKDCYGDGQLLYPGSTYNVTGPISTLRLESIFEGQEDYEYLYLFKSYVAQYNTTYGKSVDASSLLTSAYYSQMFSNVTVSCSDATYHTLHDQLLTRLGKMAANLKTGVEELL